MPIEHEGRAVGDPDSNIENESCWCFAWEQARQASPGLDRAGLLKATQWDPDGIIKCGFLDGVSWARERVKRYAKQWTSDGGGPANLQFVFIKEPSQADIRISFKFAGSWSVLGKTALQVADKTRPTMNFGWLTPACSEDEVRRVVLHEFGHAIGLVHEHQNPKNGIAWNRTQVIKDLSGPPNNWSLEQIEFNVFRNYEEAEVRATPVDAASIMMYPIPKTWTTNGFSAGLNSDLTATDRSLVTFAYR
jgi:serralysin